MNLVLETYTVVEKNERRITVRHT